MNTIPFVLLATWCIVIATHAICREYYTRKQTNVIIDYIEQSELVQAAITESVHRFYYDRCLSEKHNIKDELFNSNASDLLSNLWNLQPNWRYILKKSADRYYHINTQSVSIYGKPKNKINLLLSINITSCKKK